MLIKCHCNVIVPVLLNKWLLLPLITNTICFLGFVIFLYLISMIKIQYFLWPLSSQILFSPFTRLASLLYLYISKFQRFFGKRGGKENEGRELEGGEEKGYCAIIRVRTDCQPGVMMMRAPTLDCLPAVLIKPLLSLSFLLSLHASRDEYRVQTREAREEGRGGEEE